MFDSMQQLLRDVPALTQLAGVRVPALFTALGLVIVVAVRFWVLHSRVRTLESQAITDPLTGAFNRRHFDAALINAIERRSRLGEPASLLLFDIDRFKPINDTFGHAAGDGVLRALADVVRQRTRKLDVLFRTGGEEFALLLPATRRQDALVVAEDLRERVAAAKLLDARRVTISIGVGELGDAQSAGEWLADADAALYLAKRSGRNRVGILASPAGARSRPGARGVRALGQR